MPCDNTLLASCDQVHGYIASRADLSDDVPRAKHQKPPDPFSHEESETIIAEAARVCPGQVHNLIDFRFWTGLRTSEIFGLQWLNVDLPSGTTRTLHRDVPHDLRDMDGWRAERSGNGEARIDANVLELSPQSKTGAEAPVLLKHSVGWLMGLEPTTTGITILDSTN